MAIIIVQLSLVIATFYINFAKDLCMPYFVQGIIYARYRISVNDIMDFKTVLYLNSYFPSFLMYRQDRVVLLKYTGL